MISMEILFCCGINPLVTTVILKDTLLFYISVPYFLFLPTSKREEVYNSTVCFFVCLLLDIQKIIMDRVDPKGGPIPKFHWSRFLYFLKKYNYHCMLT